MSHFYAPTTDPNRGAQHCTDGRRLILVIRFGSRQCGPLEFQIGFSFLHMSQGWSIRQPQNRLHLAAAVECRVNCWSNRNTKYHLVRSRNRNRFLVHKLVRSWVKTRPGSAAAGRSAFEDCHSSHSQCHGSCACNVILQSAPRKLYGFVHLIRTAGHSVI